MRLLLSCVNTVVSLIGYDFDKGESFWYCPADRLRACGACYDGRDLLLGSDDYLTRVSPSGVSQTRLPGPHENLAHGVRMVGEDLVGVADTGNSRILVMGRDGARAVVYDPLDQWDEVPPDAIHLNDFLPVEHGFLASCFHYQPFRPFKEALGYEAWKTGGFGLILGLSKERGLNVSRVLACGLNQPHSLAAHEGRIFCCSSATGSFLEFSYTDRGLLRETGHRKVTDEHFLRGALRAGDGWFLGGSSIRRGRDRTPMAVYRLSDSGEIESRKAAKVGEIYDVLPWREEVMADLIPVMNALPKQDWEIGECPPPRPYP
jgi:hypothetical protein